MKIRCHVVAKRKPTTDRPTETGAVQKRAYLEDVAYFDHIFPSPLLFAISALFSPTKKAKFNSPWSAPLSHASLGQLLLVSNAVALSTGWPIILIRWGKFNFICPLKNEERKGGGLTVVGPNCRYMVETVFIIIVKTVKVIVWWSGFYNYNYYSRIGDVVAMFTVQNEHKQLIGITRFFSNFPSKFSTHYSPTSFSSLLWKGHGDQKDPNEGRYMPRRIRPHLAQAGGRHCHIGHRRCSFGMGYSFLFSWILQVGHWNWKEGLNRIITKYDVRVVVLDWGIGGGR